jgi:ubiquinone/menaquinone biosynthesis C-methylase UbiE
LESPEVMFNTDITNMIFTDETFNFFICNHVLEHLEDDNKAIKKLFLILKPGGWGILSFPIDINREDTFEDDNISDPKIRKKLFGLEDHYRIYARDILIRIKEMVKSIRSNSNS